MAQIAGPARPSAVGAICVAEQVLDRLEDGIGMAPVNGGVPGPDQIYDRLHRTRAVIDRDTAASMSLEDHRHMFAAAMAVLLAGFNTYLDQDHADPTADSVGYRQGRLWLSQDELAGLINEVQGAIVARRDNEPAPDRRPYLVSPILFPIGESRCSPPAPVSRTAPAEPTS